VPARVDRAAHGNLGRWREREQIARQLDH
jgi:hypothetical protein